jgi:hypothetical protein
MAPLHLLSMLPEVRTSAFVGIGNPGAIIKIGPCMQQNEAIETAIFQRTIFRE